ncbi:MAG: hypothetical protein ACRELC_00005, partial [Gemmatimonadota bacterium]
MGSRRSLARCLAAWTVVGSAWVLVSRWLAPRLVRAAYEERSLGFVNRWLAGRDTHPLAEYLESWEALAARIDVALAALAVLTSVVLLFGLPERARRWKVRVEAHERGGASLRFSVGETFLAAALIGLGTGCLSGAYTAYVNHGRREAIPGSRILAVDVVWMAPLADVLFFLVLAGVLVGVGKAWSGLTVRRRTLLPLLFAAGTGVLMLPGWFHAAAALILAFALAYHGSRYLSVAWSPKRSREIAVSLVVLVGAAAIFVRSSVALSERRTLDSLPDRPPDAPNVILVILDAVRARNLGAYGYERPTS